MTGEKNRSTTTEKLWKLDDNELSTPKHDELVLMLLNKEYSLSKIRDPKEHNLKINTIRSEVPVTSNNHFIIGFIDIVITTEKRIVTEEAEILCPKCGYHPIRDKLKNCQSHIGKKATCHKNNSCGEFIITNELIKPVTTIIEKDYYIECKPSIRSFGETLRQMNLYRSAIIVQRKIDHFSKPDDVSMILFTPDTRFKDAFESQGITVVSP